MVVLQEVYAVLPVCTQRGAGPCHCGTWGIFSFLSLVAAPTRSLRGGWVGWAPACGCALSEMRLVPACVEPGVVSFQPGGAFLVYLGEHLKTVARVPGRRRC